MLLGDLGRSDVQAYLLHNSIEHSSQNELAYGRTYVGAVSILIPQQLWPTRPPNKVKEGTDALYGKGAWDYGITASNVYGLAGETILNFGFIGVPFAYAVLGFVVATIRRRFSSLTREDGRIFLVPFWVIFCVIMMVGDSDNLIFFTISNGLLPMFLVWGSLKKCAPSTFQRQ